MLYYQLFQTSVPLFIPMTFYDIKRSVFQETYPRTLSGGDRIIAIIGLCRQGSDLRGSTVCCIH